MDQPLFVRYANHSHARCQHEVGTTLQGTVITWSALHGRGLISVNSGGPDVHLGSSAHGVQRTDAVKVGTQLTFQVDVLADHYFVSKVIKQETDVKPTKTLNKLVRAAARKLRDEMCPPKG
eukprot:gnl/TRDRNA2_/TRDRNA2_125645_c0_seq1.p1 gnl/TRDRNA2_/TRDRNA2_125645_c0~~gnl/TRDRNA2_/TRDRNA2_125645_c0_seq1.p1  ORF type:complete len:121 (+),score=9.63 gnl/TRDRNA2_/TRDRNA2_125645_c0_seq1:2-364(+)